MKKITIVLIILVAAVFFACVDESAVPDTGGDGKPGRNPSSNEQPDKMPIDNNTEVYGMNNIDFIEKEKVDIDWDQIQFPIDLKEIGVSVSPNTFSTRKEAVETGNRIIEDCWVNNYFTDYVLLTIVRYTQDNIWYFMYSIDQGDSEADALIECGGFYVVIDGSSGEVIQAWIDE